MPLTRKFSDTVQARARIDTAFRVALFEAALQAVIDGELDEARQLFRDCINATVGFQTISEKSCIPVKSLMRMLGPSGNPTLDNFTSLIRALQLEMRSRIVVKVLSDNTEGLSEAIAIESSNAPDSGVFGESQFAEAF